MHVSIRFLQQLRENKRAKYFIHYYCEYYGNIVYSLLLLFVLLKNYMAVKEHFLEHFGRWMDDFGANVVFSFEVRGSQIWTTSFCEHTFRGISIQNAFRKTLLDALFLKYHKSPYPATKRPESGASVQFSWRRNMLLISYNLSQWSLGQIKFFFLKLILFYKKKVELYSLLY